MAMNFPSNPADGATAEAEYVLYTYDSAKGYWLAEKINLVQSGTTLKFGSPADLMLMGRD